MSKVILKTYDAYKDSEVEWLGEIPSHWDRVRHKDVFSLLNERGVDSLKPKLALENIEGFTGRFIPTDTIFEGDGIEFKTGDILFGKLRPYLAKVLLAPFDGRAVGDIFSYRLRQSLKTTFAQYLMLSDRYLDAINSSTAGAKMPRVSSQFMANLPVGLPPLPEQEVIAAYLDEKTAGIDQKGALLEKKAEHYKSLKQSLINETVTRGLDKSAALKESGINWIGQIPQHWEVKRVKELASANPSNIDKITRDGERRVFLCNYVDVYKNNSITDGISFMQASASEENIKKFRLHLKDVIITKDSEGAEDIAQAALVKYESDTLVCGYHLNMIRPKNKKLEGSFLFYQFGAVYWHDQFKVAAKGITRVGLSVAVIRDALLPLPPLSEQQEIADYLDEKTAQIDGIIASIARQVETLKELRKTLINDVVTGKIKVVES